MSDIRYEESGAICSHGEYISELENGIEQLEKENKILRECAEFYADIDTYEYLTTDKFVMVDKDNCIKKDLGKKAIETLKQLGEK